MARSQPPRDILKIIFTNFINSLKPRKSPQKLIGTDYLGTKYFEVKADPRINRRGGRWFLPSENENFEQEIPPEWESWLRGRRHDPPTDEEIQQNLAIMKTKQQNAALLNQNENIINQEDNFTGTFPKRLEYEQVPGKIPEKEHF